MALRRLGTVDRIAQGLLIVRTPEGGGGTDDGSSDEGPPDIGTTVVDESLSTTGRIVDVFGPVDRPYLAVDPVDGLEPTALLGDVLYAR